METIELLPLRRIASCDASRGCETRLQDADRVCEIRLCRTLASEIRLLIHC
jgi:hypothetical protein